MKRLDEIEAYLSGELADGDADAFEAKMFDAPDDVDVAIVDRIARYGRRLVEHGTWNIGATRAQLDELIAAGHRVQIYDCGPPGTTKAFRIEEQFELFVTMFRIGRKDIPRVDVEVFLKEHNISKVIKDVPVDVENETLFGLCERPLAEMGFGQPSIVTVRTSGHDEVLGVWELVSHVAA